MKPYLLLASFFALFMTNNANAHCEIPCGIFDDGARFELIMEHARTIEKSMNEINTLSNAEKPDIHTISRWTANKESHAEKIQEIASRYFLAQRVKVPAKDANEESHKDYVKHTILLHQIIVSAMKTKQTTDVEAVEKLRDVTAAYKKHYFKEHGHTH